MSPSMKKISFSLLFAVVIFSLISKNAESKYANLVNINRFCKPSSNLRLCNRMVRNANNLQDAAVNSINAALVIAKRIQELVPFVIQAVSDLPKSTATDLIKTCTDSFESSVEDLQKALECIKKGDKNGADTFLSAALRSECTDALKQEGENVPLLTKLNEQFYKLVDNALAVALQRYANEMWGGGR